MFTERKWATIAVIGAILITVGGLIERQNLKVGDLAPGAPEFRPNSRYNRNNKYTVDHYGASSDLFMIFAKTELPPFSAQWIIRRSPRFRAGFPA
jgi:uncharacterized protein